MGAFHQPALVLCDPSLLETLPPAEYQNGCAEIIKCALLQSQPLFRAIAEKPVSRQWESVIAACVEIKGDFIQSDEFDTGRRRLLNLGHTVGHAIEAVSGYTVPHGSAVSIGMATATRAACRRGLCAPETLSALENLLAAYGLPTATDYTAQALAAAALSDKKRRGDTLPLVLPEAIGRCRLEPVSVSELPDWFRDGGLL